MLVTPSMASVLDWVSTRTGLRVDRHRRGDMAAGVRDAMAVHGVDDPLAFLRHLEVDGEAEAALVDRMVIGETYFFRDPGQLELLASTVLPALATERRGAPLRLCSAGCATGEEAYTLAMLTEESGHDGATVVGVDLCTAAIARARQGHYGRWSLRGVDGDRRRRFFRPEGDGFAVVDRIQRRARFEVLNLAQESLTSISPGVFDVILCRNVLMYLGPDVVPIVLRRLAARLAPGGWLMTAPTDPWVPDVGALETVHTAVGTAYRLPAEGPGHAARRCRSGAAAPLSSPRQRAGAAAPGSDGLGSAFPYGNLQSSVRARPQRRQ